MTYSARSDVEDIFGEENVRQWADVENNGNSKKISNRIIWAIGLADAHINGRLKDGPYTVPFTEPVIDKILIDLSARKAGIILYSSRRMIDSGEEVNQVSIHEKMLKQTFADIHAGRIRLTITPAVKRYPQSVSLSDD